MKNIIIAIAFAIVAVMSYPDHVSAGDQTNDELFRDIHAELNELQALVNALESGTVKIWLGYEVTIPAALRTQIISRCGDLRTSIREKFQQLSLD